MKKLASGAVLCALLMMPLKVASGVVSFVKEAEFGKETMVIHVVRPGQNLGKIASWYGSSSKEVRLLNGLSSNTIFPKQKLVIRSRPHTAIASWYGPGFHGRPMASGKIFLQQEIVAAHKHLPLGSLVRIVNPKNGAALVVPIMDRGPYIAGREYDLSRGTAEALGTIEPGVARLIVQVIPPSH